MEYMDDLKRCLELFGGELHTGTIPVACTQLIFKHYVECCNETIARRMAHFRIDDDGLLRDLPDSFNIPFRGWV